MSNSLWLWFILSSSFCRKTPLPLHHSSLCFNRLDIILTLSFKIVWQDLSMPPWGAFLPWLLVPTFWYRSLSSWLFLLDHLQCPLLFPACEMLEWPRCISWDNICSGCYLRQFHWSLWLSILFIYVWVSYLNFLPRSYYCDLYPKYIHLHLRPTSIKILHIAGRMFCFIPVIETEGNRFTFWWVQSSNQRSHEIKG